MISNFTITVHELIESGFDFHLDRYEIFDENYRQILNNCILEEFRFKEIAWQNPVQWRNRFIHRLDTIMRNKYNALYEAKKIEFNALFNVDMTETFTHTIDNTNNSNTDYTENSKNQNSSTSKNDTSLTSTENTTTNNKNKQYNSSFPSTSINDEDYTQDKYLDGAIHQDSNVKDKTETENDSFSKSSEENSGNSSSTSNSKNSGNNKTQETYTRITKGSSAGLPFSKAMIQLKEFYDKFELDQQVCDELRDLFINVWRW